MNSLSFFKSVPVIVMMMLLTQNMQAQGESENPFFNEFKTPYGVPPFDKIKFDHYQPALEEGMRRQIKEIEAIASNPKAATFENTLAAYDASGEMLARVSSVFYNNLEANTDEKMQNLAEEMSPAMSKHSDDIMLNAMLFARIKAVYESRASLNSEQQRLTEIVYLDFVRSGANLNDEGKKRLRELNEKLALLELQFGNNVMADNNAFTMVLENKEDLAGLPQSVIDAAAEAAKENKMDGKWLFTVDKPSMIPFLQYSDRRDLREKLYRGYFMRGDNNNENDNKENIKLIVALRLEKANLLGYENYASFILDRNMSKTPEKVYELTKTVWDASIPVVKQEAADIQEMMYSENKNEKLEPWDWWYYSEKIRKEKYDLDEEMLRPYFSIDNVREGIFILSNKLYGITFKKLENIPVYHPDVTVYEVLDSNKKHLAVLYMDFYPRASKRGGAWCTSYRDQYVRDGKNITPVVSIVMNFTAPTANSPALLNLDETLTFFHEFGHALHGFFSDVNYKRLSGYVPRDFVELPSQVMEHWTLHPELLKLYAKHYKTGEIIPADLVEKVENSGHFNQGFATAEFIAAAVLDMDYHTIGNAENIDIDKFEETSMKELGLINEILPRYRSTYFNHIFSGGYSAGYYSYLWSEVLDSDAFEAFEESGNVFNRTLANKFRNEVLAPGGKRDPMDMYKAFRGREPKVEALLRNRGFIK